MGSAVTSFGSTSAEKSSLAQGDALFQVAHILPLVVAGFVKVLPFQPSTGLGSEGPYILHDDPRDWQRLCQACVAVPLPHGHSPSAGIPSKILQAKVQLRECSLGI